MAHRIHVLEAEIAAWARHVLRGAGVGGRSVELRFVEDGDVVESHCRVFVSSEWLMFVVADAIMDGVFVLSGEAINTVWLLL